MVSVQSHLQPTWQRANLGVSTFGGQPTPTQQGHEQHQEMNAEKRDSLSPRNGQNRAFFVHVAERGHVGVVDDKAENVHVLYHAVPLLGLGHVDNPCRATSQKKNNDSIPLAGGIPSMNIPESRVWSLTARDPHSSSDKRSDSSRMDLEHSQPGAARPDFNPPAFRFPQRGAAFHLNAGPGWGWRWGIGS